MDELKDRLTNRRGNEKQNLESLDCLLDYIWTIIVITIALVNLWIIFVVFNCLCRILAVTFSLINVILFRSLTKLFICKRSDGTITDEACLCYIIFAIIFHFKWNVTLNVIFHIWCIFVFCK